MDPITEPIPVEPVWALFYDFIEATLPDCIEIILDERGLNLLYVE